MPSNDYRDLTLPQGAEVARVQDAPTPMEMIAAIARDPSIPIDRIAALIGLQERMEAREAEKQFNAATFSASVSPRRICPTVSAPAWWI